MERLEIDLVTKVYKDQTRHYKDIRRALVCGYFTQVAHKEGSSYLTVKDSQVRLNSKRPKVDTIPLTRISILFSDTDGISAPFMLSKDETRVGPLQRICAHDTAVHPDGDGDSAGVATRACCGLL